MNTKPPEFRIKYKTPEYNATQIELRRFIESMNNKCVLANSRFGVYEHRINVLTTQNNTLTTTILEISEKIRSLEAEKYPPMDKIKDLPVVPLEDLPFAISKEN